jgi:hypothetical protein
MGEPRMDTTTRRLLATLSSRTDGYMSINQLVASVKDGFGTAYYANIYQKLHQLSDDGLIILKRAGNASLVQLNLQDYLLVDFLAQMETENKIDLLRQHPDLIPLYRDIDDTARRHESMLSIASVDVERNRKLNRVELLVLLKATNYHHADMIDLQKEILALQRKHVIKVDSLIVNMGETRDLMCTFEANPVKEMLGNKIVWFNPQAFWREIGRIARDYRVQAASSLVVPAKIADSDLQYNLNRFGYREFGATIGRGKDICIEHIAIALLLHPSARQREAAAVVLAKNPFKGNILAFLSWKYGVAENLLAILKILQGAKPLDQVQRTIDLLDAVDVKGAPADKESIINALVTYHAT